VFNKTTLCRNGHNWCRNGHEALNFCRCGKGFLCWVPERTKQQKGRFGAEMGGYHLVKNV
jgi:hypothetical protein